MTRHLSPEDFVDALDGAPPAAIAAHLEACEACRAELSELGAALREARGLEAVEPSPLFWDHFSARVKEATARESAGRGWSWTGFGWNPIAALAVAAAALAIALYVRPAAPPDGRLAQPAGEVTASMPALDDDGSWSLVSALAADVEWNELREAASPAAGTADAAIEELKPAQREALARLLLKEMGDL